MSTAVAGVQRSPHRRTGTDWDTDGAKCNPDRMIAQTARYFDRLPCDTDASLRRVRPRAAACRRATGPKGRGDPSATHPAGHVRVRPVRPVRLIRVTPVSDQSELGGLRMPVLATRTVAAAARAKQAGRQLALSPQATCVAGRSHDSHVRIHPLSSENVPSRSFRRLL